MERFRWDLGAELPGDRDLARHGDSLAGTSIALLVCGGIAAYRCPDLIRALRREGAEIQVYATDEALRFVSREVLEWCSLRPVIDHLDGRAQHIEDGRSTDLYLLIPATYSTINKFALGVADNAVTATLASALGRMQDGRCAIQVMPTMHGSMVNDILRSSLARLTDLGVGIITPRPGAGKANIAATDALVSGAARALAGLGGRPDLRGRRVLVTGGSTPVAVDAVRQLTNRFGGATAIAIATAFYRAGAQVELLLSGTKLAAPGWIPTTRVADFDAYRAACLASSVDVAIFCAAVADYRPVSVDGGKIPSGQKALTLQLEPTEKVVDLWRAANPEATVVSFKLEAGLSDDALIAVGSERLGAGSDLVVANHAVVGVSESLYLITGNAVTSTSRTELGGALVAWLAAQGADPSDGA